ncbi:MAG: hypothetical protein ABI721_02805 [Candidatus Dojkabacteria bacterium]
MSNLDKGNLLDNTGYSLEETFSMDFNSVLEDYKINHDLPTFNNAFFDIFNKLVSIDIDGSKQRFLFDLREILKRSYLIYLLPDNEDGISMTIRLQGLKELIVNIEAIENPELDSAITKILDNLLQEATNQIATLQ